MPELHNEYGPIISAQAHTQNVMQMQDIFTQCGKHICYKAGRCFNAYTVILLLSSIPYILVTFNTTVYITV